MGEVLRAIEVAFEYPHEQRQVKKPTGLKPVSLTVQEGEGFLVRGQSGCGKSTLARCFTGIIPHLYNGKFSGQVTLSGKKTDQATLWELSECAGMVFQNPSAQMLAATVEDEIIFGLENLGLPPGEIHTRLEEGLQNFNLLKMRQRNPHTLSGGEQQKLALAAIMARQPKILVLDEPLSMLDTSAVYDFVSLLQNTMADGTSIVICEYRSEPLTRLPLQVVDLSNDIPDGEDSQIRDWLYEPDGRGQDREKLLLVEKLSVTLGNKNVLQEIDLSLKGGQVTAILGRNGSGKTTLLRTLAGFQPYQGNVGVRNSVGMEQARLGMVFQNPDLQLFNPNVREEILFRLEKPDMKLYDWLLEGLDLQRYEFTPPLLLSEGEKRRLALATVLMRTPEDGILLDEPALGQDRAHKQMLISILRAVASTGRMVTFATHDLELAAQADNILLLGEGKVIASGASREMLGDHEVWRKVGLRIPEWMAK